MYDQFLFDIFRYDWSLFFTTNIYYNFMLLFCADGLTVLHLKFQYFPFFENFI